MGKRKDMIHPRFHGDGGLGLHGIHKRKHKKHKKHKRKHHREEAAGGGGAHHHGFPQMMHPEPQAVMVPRPPPPQLRLKIKLGGQTLGTKNVPTFTVHPGVARPPSPLMIIDDESDDEDDDDEDEEPSVPLEQYRAWLDEDSNMAASPLPDMDSDVSMLGGGVAVDEEERWLDALEKGELDDNGELKKEIDESLLTARQKALLHKQQSQPLLLELPMGYKEKEMTAEMMQKREERARKRRAQAAKKAEDSKNQTIERLTKTNKAKMNKTTGGGRGDRGSKSKQVQIPMVRYSDSALRGVTISFPAGVPAPVPAPPPPGPPPPPPPQAPTPRAVGCGVVGCANPKRYSCSRTGVPLCSLECYKKNLLLVDGAAA